MKKSYSGNQITRAGNKFIELDRLLKNESEFDAVMDVLSYWRLCHERPLTSALELVRRVVSKHDKDALFAKRLKRYIAIYNKL